MKYYTFREYAERHNSVRMYGLSRKNKKKEIIEFIKN